MKVAFLAYYPPELFSTKLKLKQNHEQHPATWIVNLVNAISQNSEIELHIIAESKGLLHDQVIKSNNAVFHFIKSPRLPNQLALYYFNKRKLLKKVREVNPDIVHVHGVEGCNGLAGISTNVPTLISIQGVLTRYSDAMKKYNIKVDWRFKLSAICERYILKKGKYFGVRTDFDREFVISINPNANLFYAPETMNDLFFTINPSLLQNSILYVGSVIPLKDVLTLVKAVCILKSDFPDIKLTIVGSQNLPYSQEILSYIEQNNCKSNIIFFGKGSPDQIATLMENASILVHPSIIENSPNVIAEAMCAGLPIIACDVGGITSMVQHGKTGILIPPRNPQLLSEKIRCLLESYPLRKSMSENGRNIAKKRYKSEVVASQIIGVYKNILNISSENNDKF